MVIEYTQNGICECLFIKEKDESAGIRYFGRKLSGTRIAGHGLYFHRCDCIGGSGTNVNCAADRAVRQDGQDEEAAGQVPLGKRRDKSGTGYHRNC